MKSFLLLVFACSITIALHAQQPFRNHREAIDVRYSTSQPVIHYTIRIDSSDLSKFYVTMNIKNVKIHFVWPWLLTRNMMTAISDTLNR